MEAVIELLRSNYIYIQVFRSIGKNFETTETLDFFCWQEREICLLARERDLSVGERDLCVGDRDLSVG